jgi:hypothetical protein
MAPLISHKDYRSSSGQAYRAFTARTDDAGALTSSETGLARSPRPRPTGCSKPPSPPLSRMDSSAAGRIIARSAGSLTASAVGSAAGEPDLLGRPAPDPLVGELGKVVVDRRPRVPLEPGRHVLVPLPPGDRHVAAGLIRHTAIVGTRSACSAYRLQPGPCGIAARPDPARHQRRPKSPTSGCVRHVSATRVIENCPRGSHAWLRFA